MAMVVSVFPVPMLHLHQERCPAAAPDGRNVRHLLLRKAEQAAKAAAVAAVQAKAKAPRKSTRKATPKAPAATLSAARA